MVTGFDYCSYELPRKIRMVSFSVQAPSDLGGKCSSCEARYKHALTPSSCGKKGGGHSSKKRLRRIGLTMVFVSLFFGVFCFGVFILGPPKF